MKHTSAVLLTTAFLLLLSASLILADSSKRIYAPNIVPKGQWGSLKEGEKYQDQVFDPYSQGPLGDPLAITVHHTYRPAGANPPNPEEDKKKLQEIQDMHVGKGWGDIGYHLLIGSDGTVYQGRPLGWMGTHAPPNSFNIGVNVIGDFYESEYPSTYQIEGLVGLLSWLCDKYDIDPTNKATIYGQTAPTIAGHRDWNPTICPGDRLYALLPEVRNRVRANLLAGHPPYDARPSVLQYFPKVLLAGQQYSLDIAVRNVGYVPWVNINKISLESLSPNVIAIAEPALKDGETVGTLSNRSWPLQIRTPATLGAQHLAVGMSESHGRFGDEIAWDAEVLGPDAFVSTWLTAGPFTVQTTDPNASAADAAFGTDFFAGKPIDVMDTFDEASEKAHGYAVTAEYTSGERNFRGPDGIRTKESGRYFFGEETMKFSLTNYKGGDVILRRLIDGTDRDQRATISIGNRWATVWSQPGRSRGWREADTIIPSYCLRNQQSVEIKLRNQGTVQYGCNSFRYTLLSAGEPLLTPKIGDRVADGKWQQWKSHSGVTDLSSAFPGKENGAVYLATYVKSPKTCRAEIRTGVNGQVKAWVNGDPALMSIGGKPSFPDTASGSVVLKSGWNCVLVKVVLEPGMKDLYVRFCDRDGKPIPGLTASVEPNATHPDDKMQTAEREWSMVDG